MGRLISRSRLLAAFPLIAAIAIGFAAWHRHDGRHYLSADPAAFAASFEAPTPRDSPATRIELEELLALQASRTAAQVAAARADRKTDIERFYPALGLDPKNAPDLPHLHRLAERVEDDVRIYVRAVKERFRRLRPYAIEPRLAACIDDIRGDLSYPSGHAAYAYAMASVLVALVPERAAAIESRAREFARQRMMCGVHFPSDLDAGRTAAVRLVREMWTDQGFVADLAAARSELRSATGMPMTPAVD